MGSPCLFTRQQALKMGYFYSLRVRNSSLDYLKDTKFYLQSKVSFIHRSSIASFKPFLIAWLREYCTFSDSSVVSLKSSLWLKYIQYGTIFPSSNMFFIRLFLANTKPKNRGSPCSFNRKGAFISLSISYVLYAHALMCAHK